MENQFRGKLLAYQRECDDTLNDHRTEGSVVNPGSEEFQVSATMHGALKLAADLAEERLNYCSYNLFYKCNIVIACLIESKNLVR